MKVVECQHSEFGVVDRPEPTPAKGQVRLKVLRCGICGSDLHARHNIDDLADVVGLTGYKHFGRSSESVVFGHEFSGEIDEYGPKTKGKLPVGTPVVALPLIRNGKAIDPVGLSTHAPGAYAEQLLVQESLMMAIPNGLPADVAVMTEPMAVSLHAVRRGEVKKKQVAIVIGCGPIGLGIILMLKATGVRTVVASDFSRGRRGLAAACGADVVVDPRDQSPYLAAGGSDHLNDFPAAAELMVGTREKLGRLPIGWWHTWRLIEKLGIEPPHPVIFECVGVPGIIDDIIAGAPMLSRIVVAGVCMNPDTFRPGLAINKEVDLRFALAYSPLDFHDTLHMIADGQVDPRPLITGVVGLDEVDAAFDALVDPDAHAKILIDPQSKAPGIREPAGG